MAYAPLHALHTFLVVARRRSFAGAAKELGVSTSAVSQAVQQLEARVGLTLLSRTSRSVSVTEAGRRLLESAGPGLDQALDALRVAGATPDEVRGRLRISVPRAAVSLVLTRLVPRFVERHPQVVLDVSVDDGFVDIVGAGMDAGIRLIEAIDHDMVQVRLCPPARFVVAGAPAYLERRGVPKTPAELLAHDCFTTRWRTDAEPWAWELLRGKKTVRVPVRGPVIANDFELIRALAVGGLGLLYALEPSVAEELGSGRLRSVLENHLPTVPGLFLYYPSRTRITSALRAFVAVAREVAGAPSR